ncbi:hypothetical protein PR003_g816 [Phytophthora rubi]|uniref:Integrase catalytic domain-containing protein n=2 Tax=Phytophthora rubi TaxID=129364 RepID=A0A6A4G9A0_9STRA|nr:hypothetical protein PR003_g816 [Phytophthora rubi]
MMEAVQHSVSACQDCGSRKAHPKVVMPPLRSVWIVTVCGRWAIDIAGPLPMTANDNLYVIEAVEYTTRYAVATAVPENTAKSIARFLMDKVVLVDGFMREIMMDGAIEFTSKATGELLDFVQVKQATPMPYRPNVLGLVERFHRTWKDIVSLCVDESQVDWDDFLPRALYAYNSSNHATHGYQPNDPMMGRKLRTYCLYEVVSCSVDIYGYCINYFVDILLLHRCCCVRKQRPFSSCCTKSQPLHRWFRQFLLPRPDTSSSIRQQFHFGGGQLGHRRNTR